MENAYDKKIKRYMIEYNLTEHDTIQLVELQIYQKILAQKIKTKLDNFHK